jgi:uncharacterized protein CbrC (UPF0167 family)
MTSDLRSPQFTYFTPAAFLAVVEPSSTACDACGQAKGVRYTGPFYSRTRDLCICPDCIANGTAATKFNGTFNDIVVEWEGEIVNQEAHRAGTAIVDELLHRTPGYSSWQGNIWMFHCADGAVFHGDAFSEEIDNAADDTRKHWETVNGLKWDRVMHPDVRDKYMGVYRFDCRHCGLVMLHWDFT